MKNVFSFCHAVVFVLALLVNTNVCYSQPGGGPGPCTTPPCNPPNPPGLPIDGGAIFLLSSGLLYGVNRLRRKEE
ncbi:MAG: hypothetical protein COA67_02290 [Lutibacter sp.]|nr:MAG: hypothetical protein COA67_02290 [Lutibacter sp.]